LVTPYEDYVTRINGNTTWQLDSGASATEASLTGTCENGMRIKRRLRLEGSVLHTETMLENPTNRPLPAALQSRWDVDPGDLRTVAVRYRKQDGGAVERALIEPEKMPAGSESYNGGDQPDGEWRVVNRGAGLAMINRFPKEQVGRCSLTWTAKSENRVGLTVWSVSRVLRPGEQLKLNADYGVE